MPAPVTPAAVPQNSVLPTINRQQLPLSPGDRLRIQIPGVGGEEFSGEYNVNFSGDLEIPLLEPLSVLGLTPPQVQSRLRDELLRKGFFRPELLNVAVQVLNYSPIQVSITGEVFGPGRVLLSSEAADDRANLAVNAVDTGDDLPGDYPLERYLTAALKSTGGVKPTADVNNVQVLRGAEAIVVDLSGIFSGSAVADFPLVSGDQIIVPSAGAFQRSLVRPSQITPDSVNLYVSNVTEGSSNNLDKVGGINSANFKYGTSLAQALVSAQCVGGTPSTNANRRALLIQTNAQTNAVTTSEYRVMDLVSNQVYDQAVYAADDQTDQVSEAIAVSGNFEPNPFLMPDDAIACFDSRTTNIRGILGTVTNFLNPLNLLIDLFDNND
ncbi:MAG: polysaccharide biosynthesis/export family protein [Phormidesmis sp.]